jgi:hypothetical protein
MTKKPAAPLLVFKNRNARPVPPTPEATSVPIAIKAARLARACPYGAEVIERIMDDLLADIGGAR